MLGYCFHEKENDKVRAVIEIKGPGTDLDKPQQRKLKISPVDQAFSYAPKYKGECRWVIVSNISEIRFYPANDRSRCQAFFLSDLRDESKLKELLFLFHKDKLLNEFDSSPTEKLLATTKAQELNEEYQIHIIDQLYASIRRFDGLGFVDPDYVCTIKPFNILDDHVWHYDDGDLFTLNPEIFELLQGVTIENRELKFTKELEAAIEKHGVLEAKQKLTDVFTFLNHCTVKTLTAIKDYKWNIARNKNTIGFTHRSHFHFNEREGITRDISIVNDNTCECLSCLYRRFDFKKLITKLKKAAGDPAFNTMEYAYGNVLVSANNYKTAYLIYRSMESDLKGRQYKGVPYFMVRMNLKWMHNLLLDYGLDDREEILAYIKSIDLDKVVYDEIEYDIDPEVRN